LYRLFFGKIKLFYTHLFSNTNLFNGKPQKFLKQQLLPLQLCIASIQGKAETENVTEPKSNKPIVLQLEFRMQANVAVWDVLKIMGKLPCCRGRRKISRS
jgi:hypothetical protein